MDNFIAVVSSVNGGVTKFQGFEDEASANAHVAEFGGFAAPNPGGSHLLFWDVDEAGKTLSHNVTRENIATATESAKSAITELETIPRRIREVLIAANVADQSMIDEDNAIQIERANITV